MIEIIALFILSAVGILMLVFIGFWIADNLLEAFYALRGRYERFKRKLEFNRLCTCWNHPKDRQQCVVHQK